MGNFFSGHSPSSLEEQKKKAWHKSWIVENLISLGMALLIVFTIRSSIVEAFKIPSGSMIPTLLVGDHIFVNKFAYGFKVPFSDWVTNRPLYLIRREAPQRGDIIVFKYPKDESIYYIKRVVGVEGDTVELRNKLIYINEKPMSRDVMHGPEAEKIFKSIEDAKFSSGNVDLYTEHLGTVNHSILLDKTNFMGESFGPITVPKESLFVMGDNRDFSSDSRFWGFVPLNNVKGKAMIVWMSLWVSLTEGQFIFRPSRMGTLLH